MKDSTEKLNIIEESSTEQVEGILPVEAELEVVKEGIKVSTKSFTIILCHCLVNAICSMNTIKSTEKEGE